jgi:hypothetical protein
MRIIELTVLRVVLDESGIPKPTWRTSMASKGWRNDHVTVLTTFSTVRGLSGSACRCRDPRERPQTPSLALQTRSEH